MQPQISSMHNSCFHVKRVTDTGSDGDRDQFADHYSNEDTCSYLDCVTDRDPDRHIHADADQNADSHSESAMRSLLSDRVHPVAPTGLGLRGHYLSPVSSAATGPAQVRWGSGRGGVRVIARKSTCGWSNIWLPEELSGRS